MIELRFELDKLAVETAREQAAELRKRYDEDIPPDLLRAARMAFADGARRALIDGAYERDIEATMLRLIDRWAESFASALRGKAGASA